MRVRRASLRLAGPPVPMNGQRQRPLVPSTQSSSLATVKQSVVVSQFEQTLVFTKTTITKYDQEYFYRKLTSREHKIVLLLQSDLNLRTLVGLKQRRCSTSQNTAERKVRQRRFRVVQKIFRCPHDS